MKKYIHKLLREGLNKGIGYKVMRYENGELISGANSRLTYPAEIDYIINMGGNGIYMSPNRDYVIDYYSGLADDEMLVTFEYNMADIISGDLTDREPEISVSKAKIINLEEIK